MPIPGERKNGYSYFPRAGPAGLESASASSNSSVSTLRCEHASIVHSRTALIVVSDGYDTGDPSQLAAVARRLRRRARRLVWLNPLASNNSYQPLARGMQAVLPELDLFAPANNLASIERVLPRLVLALR
jgi:uncharacterized protein with von Willebrand factor type A (vWA) domain